LSRYRRFAESSFHALSQKVQNLLWGLLEPSESQRSGRATSGGRYIEQNHVSSAHSVAQSVASSVGSFSFFSPLLPASRKPVESSGASVAPSVTFVASFVPDNPSSCKIIQNMFMDEKSSDIVFEVGKEGAAETAPPATFYAHRVILQKCSPTLMELVKKEEGSTPIRLHDVEPTTFRLVLCHLYGKRLAAADLLPKARELIAAADRYGIGHLKLEVEACLVDSTPIDVENMVGLLLFAEEKDCPLLKEAVMDFVARNKAEVLEKVSLKEVPGSLLADMLADVAREEEPSENNWGSADRLRTMRVNDLRRKVHEKGLAIEGSRDRLIAVLEENENDLH